MLCEEGKLQTFWNKQKLFCHNTQILNVQGEKRRTNYT